MKLYASFLYLGLFYYLINTFEFYLIKSKYKYFQVFKSHVPLNQPSSDFWNCLI